MSRRPLPRQRRSSRTTSRRLSPTATRRPRTSARLSLRPPAPSTAFPDRRERAGSYRGAGPRASVARSRAPYRGQTPGSMFALLADLIGQTTRLNVETSMTTITAAESVPVADPTAPLLSLRAVNKSFGAVDVLRGVDIDIRPGRVTALVGDNGAGKSTLIKGIAGIHSFDAGEYTFEGKPVTVHSPKDSNALGIEVVYQDLALCDNLDVVQNMYLGRELKKSGLLDEDTMEA